MTQMPDWGGYNGWRPVIPMSAGIELGDSCGESSYEVKKDDGTVVYTAKIPSFFGYKNGFGNLWRMMDDEQVQCNEDTSVVHLVAPSIYGTWTIGKAEGMIAYSKSETKDEGYIQDLCMEHLENFPTKKVVPSRPIGLATSGTIVERHPVFACVFVVATLTMVVSAVFRRSA